MRLAALAVLRMSLAIDRSACAVRSRRDCEPGLALAATKNALVSRSIDALRFEEFMPWPTCG